MSFCLVNARHLGAPVDLFVADGKIVTMTPAGQHTPASDCEIIDAQGLVLMPSFLDAHVHLREPGFEYKETIASGLKAALYGGFGAVMCMANTHPVNDCAAVTEFMLAQARKSHPNGPHLYPIAAASMKLEGQELTPLAELKAAGCVAVSNDGRPLASTELTRRIMEYAADFGLTLIDHCEDPTLAPGWQMNEGIRSGYLGLKGQPATGEALQAVRDIMLAEYLGLPVHIAHVSGALTLSVIAWAKARGIAVTAETCPHYLLLDENNIENYSSLYKVSPPLRSPEDRQALRRAVQDGTIDFLATDHAPHAKHEKDVAFDEAPFGFSGLDLALSLTWQLVEEQILSEADLQRLWSRRPAETFNLPYNDFAPGDPADFFLFDPCVKWTVGASTMYSKSCNTPFLGQELHGRIKQHWLAGKALL